MNIYEMIGMVGTIAFILWISIHAAKGGEVGVTMNGTAVTAGIINGTLVGGSSTVGTAQLAYTYGMSAWWFTLGGGIACLILALCFAKPFRRNGATTLIGMVENEFGTAAGVSASILNTIGTFINIISQMISASAVLAVLFPDLGLSYELIIITVLMILYVVFGGRKGAGKAGIVKLLFLYASMVAAAIIVLVASGGIGGFTAMVNGIDNPDNVHFFSLFARGIGIDAGAGVSLVLGVITTNTYASALLSAKSDQAARNGALISAFLIPPIGIGGILVGLYMRANAAMFPLLTPKTALTTFVRHFLPSGLSGVVLGTLFISVIATGAGLALGISFVLNRNILMKFSHKINSASKEKLAGRTWMVIILALACVLSMGPFGDTILSFAFMSMGLRAAAMFAPLCAALFFPGRVDRRFAVASIIAGPVAVFVCRNLPLPFDSLFIGVAVGILLIVMGMFVRRKQ